VKALTIWQPWASLIIAGAKPYEFRSWKAPRSIVGADIVIHAGARPVKASEVLDLIDRLESNEAWTTALHREKAMPILLGCCDRARPLPLSAGLGVVRVDESKAGWAIAQEFGGHPALLNDSDRQAHANFGWPMLDVRPFSDPIPCKGAQGLWNWQGGGLEQFIRAL